MAAAVKRAVADHIAEVLPKMLSVDVILKEAMDTAIVMNAFRDFANKNIANEISNRLRCGIWNGREFQKIFDENWEAALQASTIEKIRNKVGDAIDAEIKARIKKL